MALCGFEVSRGPGMIGQVGQGRGNVDQKVAVSEAIDRRYEMLTGRGSVFGR